MSKYSIRYREYAEAIWEIEEEVVTITVNGSQVGVGTLAAERLFVSE